MSSGISRQQLKAIGKESTLGSLWRGPIELYGLFVELAQTAFSDTGFSSRRWNKDEKKSNIYIVPDYIWDDVNVEKRPAIYVSLGNIECTPYANAIGEQGSMGINMRGEHGVERYYGDVKSGTVTWNVLAESRGEALTLVGDLARYLNIFQNQIKDDLCLRSFAVSQISPLAVVKEARERLQCSVSAVFSYEYSWTLVEEAPKAKIDIHMVAAE